MSSVNTILRNSFLLYVRMLISIVVSLYTARVVLQTLGVEDFGIYGLVAGVVSLFTFLNACMSGATSRFLAYEMTKSDENRLNETFNAALIVHVVIGLVILILAETVGLWVVCNKLVLPENRVVAAHWAYQGAIFCTLMTVLQVPCTACIIAHEDMNVYAYTEILHVVLKLIIVLCLVVCSYDKLITYAFLVALVSLSITIVYFSYSRCAYRETRLLCKWNASIIKPMLSFSLWDLYGNLSVSLRQQGVNIILNNFFGVMINAASSVATNVQGVIGGFSANVIMAFRPQIIKSYSVGNYLGMQKLMERAVQFSCLMLLVVTVPLVLKIEYILTLWLGHAPDYADSICQILLFMNVLAAVNSIITTAIHATGHVKRISIYAGTIAWLSLPAVYIAFRWNGKIPELAYYVLAGLSIVMVIISLFVLKVQVPQFSVYAFLKAFGTVFLLGMLMTFVGMIVSNYSESQFVSLFSSFLASSFVGVSGGFYFFLTGSERSAFCHKIKYALLKS